MTQRLRSLAWLLVKQATDTFDGQELDRRKKRKLDDEIADLKKARRPFDNTYADLKGWQRVPTTPSAMQGIDCASLNSGIREAIERSYDCFRRGPYMPATAILASRVELKYAFAAAVLDCFVLPAA